MTDGVLVNRPKDFAEKNALPLQALHDVLKAVLFPESVPPKERFDLTPDDYGFVYRNMSRYPRESGIEAYEDEEEYPQAFVKYLMYDRDDTIPGKCPHLQQNRFRLRLPYRCRVYRRLSGRHRVHPCRHGVCECQRHVQ